MSRSAPVTIDPPDATLVVRITPAHMRWLRREARAKHTTVSGRVREVFDRLIAEESIEQEEVPDGK